MLNSAGWRVQDFGKGAYMVSDNLYNALFIVSTKGVIVVDAPPTIGHNMLNAIGNTTNIPITHLIYSHAHADHIGGAYLFGKHVKIIAHTETKEILKDMEDPKRPVPDIVFEDTYDLCVGNQTVQLSYKGVNHQRGNIFIHAPEQRLLMLVDVIFPGWVPWAHIGEAEYVPGALKAHTQTLEFDFDYFIGGHLTRSGRRNDVVLAKEYLDDLKTNCANAIALTGEPANKTNPISFAAIRPKVEEANPANSWAQFTTIIDAAASYCSNVTNEKWLGKLAAADVTGFDNAVSMVQSLRIDFNVLGPFGVQP
jgi:glyoxylase-like metal-dependent hydrolase (beta-lactamase superfamily II)